MKTLREGAESHHNTGEADDRGAHKKPFPTTVLTMPLMEQTLTCCYICT